MKIKKAESQMYAERGIISEQKNKLGITLIALVITIIILIVLVAVVVNLSMGENGIMGKAQTAVDKYKQAEENEQKQIGKFSNTIESNISTTYRNFNSDEFKQAIKEALKDESFKEEVKNTLFSSMSNPVHLVSAALPYSSNGERNSGTYLASSSSYNRTNSEKFSDYLGFTDNTGWTVKKPGWYLIKTFSRAEYFSSMTSSAAMFTYLIINNTDYQLTRAEYAKPIYYTSEDESSDTLWFNEGDVIDYKYRITSKAAYSDASISIYALFN